MSDIAKDMRRWEQSGTVDLSVKHIALGKKSSNT